MSEVVATCRNPKCNSTQINWDVTDYSGNFGEEAYLIRQLVCSKCRFSGPTFREYTNGPSKLDKALVEWCSIVFLPLKLGQKVGQEQERTL